MGNNGSASRPRKAANMFYCIRRSVESRAGGVVRTRDLFERRRELCTLIDDCLLREQLCECQTLTATHVGSSILYMSTSCFFIKLRNCDRRSVVLTLSMSAEVEADRRGLNRSEKRLLARRAWKVAERLKEAVRKTCINS